MNAKDTVVTYTERVWNEGDIDALDDLCADPMLRHEAGGCVSLTLEEQRERVRSSREVMASPDGRNVRFDSVLLTGDGDDVCAVYDMTVPSDSDFARSGALPSETVGDEIHVCSVEVFRVVDGKITEVWNSPAMPGHWG